MDFGGIVSAQAAYPIVIGKKAIAGAFPHRNEIVSSIVTALDDGNPSYLIRSSSDSEFIAQRKVQKENFPAKSIGHAGDLVKMDSSQAFGNKNRIGYKCVKEKKCLCPLTVSCDQFSSAISSTSPTIIPVPPSRLMSGESTLRSRKSLINSQLRVAKQPSAEIINSQFQDAAVDNEIKPVIPYQSAYSNTASTIIHSGDPSVWGKSHIFENEAVSSVDTGNRINLDSPEPVELLNSQELDADDEWKKWRLLQYQIWENKAKSTFDIVEDNRHMHQEISESVRPHSTPVPTKKHLQCYTLESDASFDAQEIGTMSATPPNAPKSSHVYVRPHTSGAQFMRSTIVIPSPIPPDMSSNGARIHRGEWPFHIDGESGGAEIITIPEPIESDIEWDCNQLHEAELGILPKSLEDEIGMSNLKQLKKATKKRKVKSKRRSPFAKPKNYDTQPNERVAVAPMNVPQRNLSTAVRFVVKNSLHPNTSESHKTHTENCRSAAVAVHIGNEPPTNIVALNIGTSTGNNLRANTALKSHSYKSEAGIFTPPNPMPQRDDAVKVEVVESGKPEFMTDMISIDATNAVGSIAPLPFRPNSVRSVVQTPLTAKRVHRRMDTIERATAGNNGVAVPVLNLCL